MFFYRTDKGDLMRIGYQYYFADYDRNDLFKDIIIKKELFKRLEDVNLDTVSTFDILTVGDSFSAQNEQGFQNFLVSNSRRTVLNVDNYIVRSAIKHSCNDAIEFLDGILQSDFFSKVNVRYVVLETVERSSGCLGSVAFDQPIYLNNDSIKNLKSSFLSKLAQEKQKKVSYLDRAFKSNLNNCYYLFRDGGYDNNVHKVDVEQNLFSYSSDKLLLLSDDIKMVEANSDRENVVRFNNVLDDLAARLLAKNIQLVVVPAPDKYDIYYPYIRENAQYPKPVFFDLLSEHAESLYLC